VSGVIVWMGPVSTANLATVHLPADWSIVTISLEVVAPTKTPAQGLTPTDFRTYAATLGPDPLGTLMAKAGTAPTQAILASFSAGHGLLDPLLSTNGGDPRIQGVYAADSYYGLGLKPGYVKQGQASLQSNVPFWLSTSSAKGGVTIHSGSESAKVLADALGLAPEDPPSGMPKPVTCRGKGGVLWLDYQSLFSHGDHATKLCPTALDIWFGSPGAVPAYDPQGPTLATAALALALGGAAGYFGARWLAPHL
jgi:hypothetical protein